MPRPGPESDSVRVEVAVAFPDRQLLETVTLAAGSVIADALDAAGIRERFPELEIESGRVGIFGTPRPLDHVLATGDRVEVYRPLTADPREVRRQLAELKRKKR